MSNKKVDNAPINRVGLDKETVYNEEGLVLRANKEQAKRDIAKIREVAEGLTQLPNDLLDTFLHDETLLSSVIEAKRLKGDARVRQLQYITKQLNRIDFEQFSAIYDKVSYPYRQDPVKTKQIEHLIEQLLSAQTDGIETLQTRYTDPDIAHVRALARNLSKERAKITLEYDDDGRPKQPKQTKSEKALRQYLSELTLREQE